MRALSFVMLALVATASAGCSKKEQAAPDQSASPAPAELGSDPIVEEHEDVSVAWTVAPDGSARAQVRAKDGTVIRENVSGTLDWGVEADVHAVPLELDARTGVLFATGPKLEADLTPIRYALVVSGKQVSGTLHVPVEGTVALVASAKASATLDAPKVKVVGPHGGVIQVVGRERYEIVAD